MQIINTTPRLYIGVGCYALPFMVRMRSSNLVKDTIYFAGTGRLDLGATKIKPSEGDGRCPKTVFGAGSCWCSFGW